MRRPKARLSAAISDSIIACIACHRLLLAVGGVCGELRADSKKSNVALEEVLRKQSKAAAWSPCNY